MKKAATVMAILFVLPFIIIQAEQSSNLANGNEQRVTLPKGSLPAPTTIMASQVIPPAKPVIAPKEIPPGVHLSLREIAINPKSYPVQDPANLPKEPPVGLAAPTVLAWPTLKKPDISVAPNIPDPNVILQGGDNFGSATAIPAIPYSDAGTTAGYTNDYEGNCGSSGAPDVVYRFDAVTSIAVTISLCGATDYDSKLYVCVNADPNNIIACNDDYCGLQSQLNNLIFYAGTSYYIVVDGFSNLYGNYTINVSVGIPPTDPCSYGGDVLYSNGSPDGANAISSFRTLDGSFDRWAIDDMTFSQQVAIHEVHWDCLSTDFFDWNQTADIMILSDNSGVPGTVLYEIHDLPSVRIATGASLFGIPEYVYGIQGLSLTLTAGRYWLGIRPNSSTSSNNFWETAPVQGSPIYISIPDLGYPAWTPGNVVFGVDRDVSFCVSGEIIPPPDPCGQGDDVYFNGYPDYVNGWYDFRTTDGANNWFIINDVGFDNPILIHDFHWYTVDGSLDWNGTADFIIVSDNAGAPGITLFETWDVPATREATGSLPFGYPEYIYSISGLNINLPAGRYWVGLRAVGSSIGVSYWLTAPLQNSPAYIDYSAFGYPRWTPGSANFGSDIDFAFCVSGEIAPPPNPCSGGDALYFNGLPDFVNGLFTGRSLDGIYDEWVVDDMDITQASIIHEFHWYVLDNFSDWFGTADFQILADNSGTPGAVIYSMNDAPNTRIATGRTNYGLPEYLYTIGGLNLPLAPGRYWLGLRPVGGIAPNTYWETTPISGSPVFVDYPYFGWPAWTPSLDAFLTNFDVSFCVTGELASACNYIPGDVNNNSAFNGIDVSYSVGYFKGGPPPPYTCNCNGSDWFVAGDVNGNCAFNGIDVSYMVSYFKGGSSPYTMRRLPAFIAESARNAIGGFEVSDNRESEIVSLGVKQPISQGPLIRAAFLFIMTY